MVEWTLAQWVSFAVSFLRTTALLLIILYLSYILGEARIIVQYLHILAEPLRSKSSEPTTAADPTPAGRNPFPPPSGNIQWVADQANPSISVCSGLGEMGIVRLTYSRESDTLFVELNTSQGAYRSPVQPQDWEAVIDWSRRLLEIRNGHTEH